MLGNELGGPTRVNTTTTSAQRDPALVTLSGDDYGIAWEDRSTGVNRIVLRFFSNDGAPLGSEVVLHSPAETNNMLDPELAELQNGQIVVTWHDANDGGVYFRIVTRAGVKVTSNKLVSTIAESPNSANADVTVLEDGNFVIAWTIDNPGDGNDKVVYRLYDDSGSPLTLTKTIAGNITSTPGFEPAINALSDGGFSATWMNGDNGLENAIFEQGTQRADLVTMASAGELRTYAGDDFVFGSEGADIIRSGSGNDVIYANGGNDFVVTGTSFFFTSSDYDIAYGGAGDDALIATTRAQLYGEDGNDVLRGGSGDDQLFGGSGSDVIQARNGDDLIDGGGGNDLIRAGTGNDEVHGGEGGDRIYLNTSQFSFSGENLVYGDGGNDRIFGGNGDDEIRGGDGNDLIEGASGNDDMFGGANNDVFLYRGFGGFGEDIIYDFQDGIDRIRFEAGSFEEFSDLTVFNSGANAVIEFDDDNSVVLINAGGLLDASDFVFIA